MDTSDKKGREAHGHNGHIIRSNRSKDRSTANANDDALKSKPQGSSKVDGSKEVGKLCTIHLCTYNVRTLKDEDKLDSLLEELEDFKWSIIGLAETKRRGVDLIELKGGSWLYNQGRTEDNKSAKGVGFLIHAKFKNYVKEIKSYSNRVVALNIQLARNDTMCVIQVYAPTTDYEDSEVETFYEDIDKAIETIKANTR